MNNDLVLHPLRKTYSVRYSLSTNSDIGLRPFCLRS